MLVLTYSILVSLLAAFIVAHPSPSEENEDTVRYENYIKELNIVIHCYFNNESPECKDEPDSAPVAREDEEYDYEEIRQQEDQPEEIEEEQEDKIGNDETGEGTYSFVF